jgi:AraC-like DNA-binding protein
MTLQFRDGGKLSIPAFCYLLSAGADEMIAELFQTSRPLTVSLADPLEIVQLKGLIAGPVRLPSSLLLAARLAHAHAETELIRSPIQSRHGLDDGRLRRVLAYIEEHLAEDITVADLANVACLSIFHFTRAFAGTMGVPPHRYLSRRRLESAKAMITTGRASLSEIALDCQFFSQSSFTRAFRRATGMTPAEYRRRLAHRTCRLCGRHRFSRRAWSRLATVKTRGASTARSPAS